MTISKEKLIIKNTSHDHLSHFITFQMDSGNFVDMILLDLQKHLILFIMLF